MCIAWNKPYPEFRGCIVTYTPESFSPYFPTVFVGLEIGTYSLPHNLVVYWANLLHAVSFIIMSIGAFKACELRRRHRTNSGAHGL